MPASQPPEQQISRRALLALGAAGIGGALLADSCARFKPLLTATSGGAPRPMNVLFINTDQQRFDALSCAGNPLVHTPHLDRLASQGVRFTHAFTPQPMCVAARCSFHTGNSIYTNGVTAALADPENWHLDRISGTFDQNLTKLGYHCEYHGRWHTPEQLANCYTNHVTLDFIAPYKKYLNEVLGRPPEPRNGQFKDYLGLWPYTPDVIDYELRKAQGNLPGNNCPGIDYGVSSLPAEHTYTAFVADQTIDALRRCKDAPFSIASAILHPHHPQYVAHPWSQSVRPEDMVLPLTLHDKRANTPWEHWPWQIDATEIANLRLMQARYYQLVQELDHHVGRILATLDECGLAENTLVIFLSDHGEFLGDHGLTQKFLHYQEAIRIPMLMRLPGRIPAGRVVDHPVSSLDLFATIFDYAGFPCPAQEGHSLRPLIEGKPHAVPQYACSELASPEHVFVDHDWKYVWSRDPKQMDILYNLQADPRELNNLLGKNPERSKWIPEAQKIRKAMLAWMETIQHPHLETLAKSEVG